MQLRLTPSRGQYKEKMRENLILTKKNNLTKKNKAAERNNSSSTGGLILKAQAQTRPDMQY